MHSNYTAETWNQYHANMSAWEKQANYERRIVRSVPERAIVACSHTPDNDERWEPG